MQLGFVGLGKMGLNMVTRLLRGGTPGRRHTTAAPTRSSTRRPPAQRGVASLADLVAGLAPPRAVWIMVPAGAPTESTVADLAALLAPGDVIIDGGNTNFHDDVRRAEALGAKGIHYVDAGTSGGIWGLAGRLLPDGRRRG